MYKYDCRAQDKTESPKSNPYNTFGFSMNELEGRVLKRITDIEAQLTQISVQELPNRQRELESKVEKLLRSDDLPSFGKSTSSTFPISLEMRLNKMEVNQDNLLAENKKLQARINVLEESRNPTIIRQITDRLDSVIRVVNDHESNSYQVGQSINDIQQEVIALRQAVGAWDEEETQPVTDPIPEGQQEDQYQEEVVLISIHLGCRLLHSWLVLVLRL